MTPGDDIPRGDDEQLDALRDAWSEALDATLPIDADDEPHDARTAAAVHWARAAWTAQETETVVPPDVRALVAQRRKARTTSAPSPSFPWRRVAAAIVLVVGAAAWQLDRQLPTQTNTPIAMDTVPAPVEHAPSASQVADADVPLAEIEREPASAPNDVQITRADDHSIEFVSGPVRLIMVTP